ncbi:MAG: hypothetical protein P8M78_10555 [Myxococcota bacterium]|nr:hypothetical protein [Myxococcota bacterium]
MLDPRLLDPEGIDRPAVVEALARAFRDNPLNRAVIGGSEEQRLRANRAGMRASLAAAAPTGVVLIAPGGGGGEAESPVGGLIAMEPGGWPLPPPPWAEQIRLLMGQGWRTARRWGEVFEALRESHPVEPHCYLSLVGIRPDQQGRGHGASLVSHWIKGVDRQGWPAYVETDRPELLSFYSGFGFTQTGSAKLFGVSILRLWRPAR